MKNRPDMLDPRNVTTRDAIVQLMDIAGRWAENAEEELPRRIDDELKKDEAKWIEFLADLEDDYERDEANDIRDTFIAIDRAQAILDQKGCEHLEGDGTLTDLCDVVIDG